MDKEATDRQEIQNQIAVLQKKLLKYGEAASETVLEKGKTAMQETKKFVEEKPWQTAAIAAAAGVILGLVMGRKKD